MSNKHPDQVCALCEKDMRSFHREYLKPNWYISLCDACWMLIDSETRIIRQEIIRGMMWVAGKGKNIKEKVYKDGGI